MRISCWSGFITRWVLGSWSNKKHSGASDPSWLIRTFGPWHVWLHHWYCLCLSLHKVHTSNLISLENLCWSTTSSQQTDSRPTVRCNSFAGEVWFTGYLWTSYRLTNNKILLWLLVTIITNFTGTQWYRFLCYWPITVSLHPVCTKSLWLICG